MDCTTYPAENLKHMFRRRRPEEAHRLQASAQRLRTVFHKTPGRCSEALLRIPPRHTRRAPRGLFAATQLPAWVRFSSDTPPAHRTSSPRWNRRETVRHFRSDHHRRADDTTMDLLLQNQRRLFCRHGYRHVRIHSRRRSSTAITGLT